MPTPISTLKKIDDYCSTETAKILEKVKSRLEAAGLAIGDLVENQEGIYRITHYHFSKNHWGSGVNVALYGNKLRRDKTFGTHKHYISKII